MKSYFVVQQDQPDGYGTSITAHHDYPSALAMAKRKASQFPDRIYLVAESILAVVSPAPEVKIIDLRELA